MSGCKKRGCTEVRRWCTVSFWWTDSTTNRTEIAPILRTIASQHPLAIQEHSVDIFFEGGHDAPIPNAGNFRARISDYRPCMNKAHTFRDARGGGLPLVREDTVQ